MQGGSQTSCHFAPRLAAIVGGSGAGKTHLARLLQDALGKEAITLSLDDFYKDRSGCSAGRRDRINFDHPRAIDWPEFTRVLEKLRRNQPVLVPRYDFTTHTRRAGGRLLKPKAVILVEGLWLLHRPKLRRLFDYRIFLACPAHTRLRRRIQRDSGQRGRTAGAVRKQFFKTVAPMHRLHVAPQVHWADLVVRRPLRAADLATLAQAIKGQQSPESSEAWLHRPRTRETRTALELHRAQLCL